jgi:replication-associated recombination protein RarA
VPVHLRNAPTKLMKEPLGYAAGEDYRYAHDESPRTCAYAAGERQCYLPGWHAAVRW